MADTKTPVKTLPKESNVKKLDKLSASKSAVKDKKLPQVRTRTRTEQKKLTTPNKNAKVQAPGSATKSGKKTIKKRQAPAHSGVPLPLKMQKYLEKLNAKARREILT